jgi:hypothetical protein
MRHETGWKGDIGVAKATAELLRQGYSVLVPVASTSPFDLVAYRDEKFVRIQVKYRKAKNGAIEVRSRRSIVTNGKITQRSLTTDECDMICAYCPDTDECYFFRCGGSKNALTLRFSAPSNGLVKRIHWAKDYLALKMDDFAPNPSPRRARDTHSASMCRTDGGPARQAARPTRGK